MKVSTALSNDNVRNNRQAKLWAHDGLLSLFYLWGQSSLTPIVVQQVILTCVQMIIAITWPCSQVNTGGNSCPTGYPYLCSDNYCYDVPCDQVTTGGGDSCPTGYPYLCSDDYCYDVPCDQVTTGGEDSCPTGYPYLCSDDYCYNVPCSEVNAGNSCPDGYPYLCSDDYCYDIPCDQVSADSSCPAEYPYLCSDGYCYNTPCTTTDTSVYVDSTEELFNIIELHYPVYFSPSGQSTFVLLGYTVRYYSATKTYIGIKDGSLYACGDIFGGLMELGPVSDYYGQWATP